MKKRTTQILRTGAIAWMASGFAGTASAEAPRPVDLLVRNGTVVTVDANHRVIANGAIAVSGGAIVAVGPASEVEPTVRAREILDAGGGIVIPGLINAHTHAPMVAVPRHRRRPQADGLADALHLPRRGEERQSTLREGRARAWPRWR